MVNIPLYLIYSRLALGIILLILAIAGVAHFEAIASSLIVIGLLSDIFDGIIARRLKVSTEKLRRLDSIIDQAFWIMVITATYIHCPQFFHRHKSSIIILMAAEAATYAVSYARFGKEIATHAISSKLWTLTLLATVLQIVLTCDSEVLFFICFYTGLATRLENIAILLILKQWANDIPSVYHAI